MDQNELRQIIEQVRTTFPSAETYIYEAGHAFGLGHVGEPKHGRLTMSVFIDSLCENQEATLGFGDLRGLEALY